MGKETHIISLALKFNLLIYFIIQLLKGYLAIQWATTKDTEPGPPMTSTKLVEQLGYWTDDRRGNTMIDK